MSDKLVQVEHLQQYFPAGGFGKNKKYVQAVDDVSFFINRGETLGLVGESGCGKTTTGRTLLRLYEPTGGRIIYDDKVIFDKEKKIAENMLPYRKKMQIVFQDPYASLDPRMTVGDIVGEPIDIHHLASSKQERYDMIIEMLRRVGLNSEHANRYPHEFSGGQRQRVGIARALAVHPEFIVCDEPISALDVSIQAQVINMFEDLQESMNLTYLFIAHDLSVVKHISNRIGVMYLGRMVELADSYELTMHSLHPYTKSLISAIPIPDPQLEKNKVLFTYDPSIHDYSTDKPELVCIGHDHWVFGNKKEIEEYKATREKNVPLKTITILDKDAPRPEEHHDNVAHDEIQLPPLHDTGSAWYALLSFLLPVIGIIAAMIFKKHRHYRNYKMCKKGAIAGFIVLAVILALFLLALAAVFI